MESKTELRKKAKDIRKNLQIAEISCKMVKLLQKNPVYKSAKNVMLFYPTEYELDLRALLSDDKNFYFPRVNGKILDICPYSPEVKLSKSKFNIYEPCSNPVEMAVLDLIIVPALMADKRSFRLGYGGGFYDRLLSEIPQNVSTICPIPKELLVERLPNDEFDIKIDAILSV